MHGLKAFLTDLRASFWFLPSLIVAASIVLAFALIDAESAVDRSWLVHWPRLFGAGAAGARGMLSTIAGSMITVVGITFSCGSDDGRTENGPGQKSESGDPLR